jgi:PBP1b-binding outer membrane lipoprotein LpoB
MKNWIVILVAFTILSGCSLESEQKASTEVQQDVTAASTYDVSSFEEYPLVSVVDGLSP